jgi:hypothetical protein
VLIGQAEADRDSQQASDGQPIGDPAVENLGQCLRQRHPPGLKIIFLAFVGATPLALDYLPGVVDAAHLCADAR